MTKDERLPLAHHEAGHAWIAAWLGYRPTASILPGDDGSEGHVRYKHPPDMDLRHRVMIALGGPLQQTRVAPLRGNHAKVDWQTATVHALELAGGDVRGAITMLDELRRETDLILEKHWPSVFALANQLAKAGTLDADTIVAAMPTERHL